MNHLDIRRNLPSAQRRHRPQIRHSERSSNLANAHPTIHVLVWPCPTFDITESVQSGCPPHSWTIVCIYTARQNNRARYDVSSSLFASEARNSPSRVDNTILGLACQRVPVVDRSTRFTPHVVQVLATATATEPLLPPTFASGRPTFGLRAPRLRYGNWARFA